MHPYACTAANLNSLWSTGGWVNFFIYVLALVIGLGLTILSSSCTNDDIFREIRNSVIVWHSFNTCYAIFIHVSNLDYLKKLWHIFVFGTSSWMVFMDGVHCSWMVFMDGVWHASTASFQIPNVLLPPKVNKDIHSTNVNISIVFF